MGAGLAKRGKHDFAFSGLIACHACDCARIAPATPTNARAIRPRAAASMCGRKCWKLSSPNCSGGCEHAEAIKRYQAEYKRLQDRINAMYVDKLDGLVDSVFFDKMSNQWREEQNRCQREIDRHQNADKSYKDEGVALLDLARNAQRLFASQESREKRRLLNFVLSNCTWEDGEVVATFRQPFDMLAETTTAAAHAEGPETANPSKSEIWLTSQSAANPPRGEVPC